MSSSLFFFFFFLIITLPTFFFFFFFNDTATTEIYTLSLHDALPISLLEATPIGRGGKSGDRAAVDVVGIDVRAVAAAERSGRCRPQVGDDRGRLISRLEGAQLSVAVIGVRQRPRRVGEGVGSGRTLDRRLDLGSREPRVDPEENRRRAGDVRSRHAGASDVTVLAVPLGEGRAARCLYATGQRGSDKLAGGGDIGLDAAAAGRSPRR